MSKTFGQVKAGDEVYVINGNNVGFTKVQSTEEHNTLREHKVTVESKTYNSTCLPNSHPFVMI